MRFYYKLVLLGAAVLAVGAVLLARRPILEDVRVRREPQAAQVLASPTAVGRGGLFDVGDIGPWNPPTMGEADTWIVGRVHDAVTKEPIKGAWVRESGWIEEQAQQVQQVRSNSRGSFRLRAWLGQPFDLLAGAVGYSDYSGPQRYDYSQGEPDSLVKVPLRGANVALSLVRAGVVRGVVRDERGRGVEGADVKIVEDVYSGAARTRHGGFFALYVRGASPKKRSRYRLTVTHRHASRFEKLIWVRARYSKAHEVLVRCDVKARATVTGRVTSLGKPVKGAYISAQSDTRSENADEDTGGSAQSDADGRFTLSLHAPDKYEVSVVRAHKVRHEVKLRLRPGQKVFLNRDLPRLYHGSIRGRVTDLSGRSVEGAWISVLEENAGGEYPREVASTRTDTNGLYALPRIESGLAYRLAVAMPEAEMTTWPERDKVQVRAGRTTHVDLRGDVVPPQVHVLSPRPYTRVRGTVVVRAYATDNDGLAKADTTSDEWIREVNTGRFSNSFDLEGPSRHRLRKREFELKWNSKAVPDGRHRITIDIHDRYGNKASRTVHFVVQNSP